MLRPRNHFELLWRKSCVIKWIKDSGVFCTCEYFSLLVKHRFFQGCWTFQYDLFGKNCHFFAFRKYFWTFWSLNIVSPSLIFCSKVCEEFWSQHTCHAGKNVLILSLQELNWNRFLIAKKLNINRYLDRSFSEEFASVFLSLTTPRSSNCWFG